MREVRDTHPDEIKRIFDLQRSYEYEYANQSISQRKSRLKKLKKAIEGHRDEIKEAMMADFKKHPSEVDMSEILPVVAELKFALRNLGKWTRFQRTDTPILLIGASSGIRYESKGSSLIISPWNFPFLLSFVPIISGIAAGCPLIIKPSEQSPHSSGVLKKIIKSAFHEKEVCVIEGRIKTGQELLLLPFRHIYFTGSPAIGKIVMEAAAKNLTSVTLELGGKSPTIVDDTANLKKAAKRIAWSKMINGGQACLAPDYLILHKNIKNEFIGLFINEVKKFISDGHEFPESISRIVNDQHFERLVSYLSGEHSANMKIVFGGKTVSEENYIEPTILSNVDISHPILSQEIFGPILPVLDFENIEDIPGIIDKVERPLGMYIFSKSKKNIRFLTQNSRSGGLVINHSIIHIFNPNLPFGGINHSGIGKTNGHFGFLEFTNARAVMRQHLFLSATELISPPYKSFQKFVLKAAEKWLS